MTSKDTIERIVEEFEELGIITFDDVEPILDIVPKVQDAKGDWHNTKDWLRKALTKLHTDTVREERERKAKYIRLELDRIRNDLQFQLKEMFRKPENKETLPTKESVKEFEKKLQILTKDNT